MGKLKKWLSIMKNRNARTILLLGIVLFNLALWLVSSLLAYIISPSSFDNAFSAIWNAGITWMLDPGFYNPNYPVPVRVIALVVIIISMITFSGGIIGYVANLFSSIIDNAEKGKGKLFIYDHILILNWNNKALELIGDYIYDDDITNLVVLSKYEKADVEKQIDRKLYELGHRLKDRNKLNILVKQGDILSKSDLSDVCVEKAKSVIILSDLSESIKDDESDMITIKAVMLVANIKRNENQKIIIEARRDVTAKIINEKIVKTLNMEDSIIPIIPDEMMGFLIAQTLLYPEVNQVYQELFSFSGAEFYTREEKSVTDFIKCHNKSIPIYIHNGHMYILSESEKNVDSLRNQPKIDYTKYEISKKNMYKNKNILIFGNNSKLPFILRSIELYEKDSDSKVTTTLVSSNNAESIDEAVKKIGKINSILILSSDDESKKDYDSDVILTLLMIQDIAKIHKADIIIELLDPKNYDIARNYNIRNTIISNKYISKIMTQLSKNSHLYHLFLDLLTYDDDENDGTYELYTFELSKVFKGKNEYVFTSPSDLITSLYFSSNENYIVIGYVKDSITRVFKGDLDKPEHICLKDTDMLVIITK